MKLTPLILLLALALPARADRCVAKWIEPRRVEWNGRWYEEWAAEYWVLEAHYDWWMPCVRYEQHQVAVWEWREIDVDDGKDEE